MIKISKWRILVDRDALHWFLNAVFEDSRSPAAVLKVEKGSNRQRIYSSPRRQERHPTNVVVI